MPYPLQKGPLGLLELLRMKQGGKQPVLFGEQVVPVVNVTPFYGADLLKTGLTGAAAVGAVTSPLTATEDVTVGPNLLTSVGCQFVNGAAAGASLTLQWGFQVPGSASPQAPLGAISVVSYANGVFNVGSALPYPLIIPPGTRLWARATGNAVGADHSLWVAFSFIALHTG